MLHLAAKRFASMILIMLTISFILFIIFEGDKFNVATKVLGQYSTVDQRLLWLEQNGYNDPFITRYVRWLFNFVQGDFGESIQFSAPISRLLGEHLWNTGILAFWVFIITMSIALVLGVLSGIAEGSLRDRAITVISVLTTSIPEFASATIFVAIFVFWLDILPGTSPFSSGFEWKQLVLPVLVLVVYNFGYYTRMTRASMAEVMTSQYVRTAILKGLPFKRVVLRHALPNALAPIINVVALNLAYLIVSIIVVEVIFVYPGIGQLMIDAVSKRDVPLVQACGLIFAGTYVGLNMIADILAILSNPRLRRPR